MTETQTVDLAAWLTQIWDEQEKDATNPIKGEIHSRDCESTREHIPFPCECGVPEQILARNAADRRVLELHAPYDHEGIGVLCICCAGGAGAGPDWPCETLRLMASPYIDREGFQEAWRV